MPPEDEIERAVNIPAGFEVEVNTTFSYLDAVPVTPVAPPARRREQNRSEASVARRRDASRDRARMVTTSSQEIGTIPACLNPTEREICRTSFREYLLRYHRHIIFSELAPMHQTLIDGVERAVFHGESLAAALPRGSGKSSVLRLGILWSILYGHRRMAVLIASTATSAERGLQFIKNELLTNDLLLDDFPEACFPLRSLNRGFRRMLTQRVNGVHTAMKWATDHIQIANTLDENGNPRPNAGSVIFCGGITGDIRGWMIVTESGESLRPDIGMIDDPSTKESARSTAQSTYRLGIINSDISKMAGLGRTCPLMCAVTVIYEGDLASMLIDNDVSPQFSGIRHAMIESWPDNRELMDEYIEIVRSELRTSGGYTNGHEFYVANRDDLELGSRVSWEARYTDHECCALEFALHEYARDASAFLAEYQNSPMELTDDLAITVTNQAILEKQSGSPANELPEWATNVVAAIDVQQHVLYYMIAAVDNHMNGAIMHYGTMPDQRSSYFTVREARSRLMDHCETNDVDTALMMGLNVLLNQLVVRDWVAPSGRRIRAGNILVDSGYKTNQVYSVIRQPELSEVCKASRGMGIGPVEAPMSRYRLTDRDTAGHHWVNRETESHRMQVQIDVNYWKSQVHRAFRQPHLEGGSWSIYDTSRPRLQHGMLADHINSERPEPITARGRTVDVWSLRPGQSENHYLDTFVMCMAAANMMGSTLGAIQTDIVTPVIEMPVRPRRVQWAARGERSGVLPGIQGVQANL